MAEKAKPSIFTEVNLRSRANNFQHHTDEISLDRAIVRRGQSFTVTIKLAQPFDTELHPLSLTAVTGEHASEDLGTMSNFGIPDSVKRSPSAKAVWKVKLHERSCPQEGIVTLAMTPPADAPVGEYKLSAKHRGEEKLLGSVAVLFNPWCPDDSVYLSDDKLRQEYVMNEQGIIYKGTKQYIFPLNWNFAQFEEDMVDICVKILDRNLKHRENPAQDVSARCDPIYISRVVSAMINSEDDDGVLVGRWEGSFADGDKPSRWNGSHEILKRWFSNDCTPVKYGQCWVFAGVMCSVMRLLGIPCRVVTTFVSAFDNNGNLLVDQLHGDHGVEDKDEMDSIWNFHVWVECWMKRPDLAEHGDYDGWQVVDPTPQQLSDGVYCCGPASVKAIRKGNTDLQYDVPFIFAEVNADVVNWLVKPDGSKVKFLCDTQKVGKRISTKSVGCNKRVDITNTYKHKEGSEYERSVFLYATTRDYSKDDEDEETDREEVEEEEVIDKNKGKEKKEETPKPISPLVTMRFEEEFRPVNGQDVRMKLVLHSKSCDARPLSVRISVQGLKHEGKPAGNIQTEEKEATLLPDKDLSIPIMVPFSAYRKYMLESESIRISAVVTNKDQPDETYLGKDDVVLQDPPISVTVCDGTRLNHKADVEVIFANPIDEMLKDCTLTLSGSGLFRDDLTIKLPDLEPNKQVRVKYGFLPYKCGPKTLTVDLDCSAFTDIKGSCSVNVTE